MDDSDNNRVRFWVALHLLKLTDGAVEDPRIVTVGLYGYDDPRATINEMGDARERMEEELKRVVSNGKSEAVRAAAREMLRTKCGWKDY